MDVIELWTLTFKELCLDVQILSSNTVMERMPLSISTINLLFIICQVTRTDRGMDFAVAAGHGGACWARWGMPHYV